MTAQPSIFTPYHRSKYFTTSLSGVLSNFNSSFIHELIASGSPFPKESRCALLSNTARSPRVNKPNSFLLSVIATPPFTNGYLLYIVLHVFFYIERRPMYINEKILQCYPKSFRFVFGLHQKSFAFNQYLHDPYIKKFHYI